MANSYMPRRQSDLLEWMRTFSGGISANAAAYMVSPAEAASIASAVQAFGDAMALVGDPSTNTAVSIRRKDEARNAAEQLIQVYYSLIKPNRGVSDAAKIAIGVRPLNRTRMRIACPPSSPRLNILGATPGCHTLRYGDSLVSGTCAKPFGATMLELRVVIADEVVRDVNAARPVGMFTRNPLGVSFDHADDRKKATYFARWISRRGDTGPWSLPVSMSIAA